MHAAGNYYGAWLHRISSGTDSGMTFSMGGTPACNNGRNIKICRSVAETQVDQTCVRLGTHDTGDLDEHFDLGFAITTLCSVAACENLDNHSASTTAMISAFFFLCNMIVH